MNGERRDDEGAAYQRYTRTTLGGRTTATTGAGRTTTTGRTGLTTTAAGLTTTARGGGQGAPTLTCTLTCAAAFCQYSADKSVLNNITFFIFACLLKNKFP